jgi:hypothetical protein
VIRSEHKVRRRSKLARWMWERGLTARDAAGPLGKSHMTVSRYLYDMDDPDRRIPDPETMARITAWTGDEVTPNDFYAAKPETAAAEAVGAVQ